MAEVNPAVMELVQTELQANPQVTTKELYEKAKRKNRSVGRLSLRQFNARYPLQIKRKAAPVRRRSRARKRGVGENGRGAAREVLLQFAKDLLAADQSQLVSVLGDVDSYAERLATAVRSK